LSPSPASLGHRARARGFTLTELLAVLAMISVLVVAASPVFVNMTRDRRVNRAAMQLVDLFRTARTRAMGRNLPVMVQWDATNGNQLATMLEPDVTNFVSSKSCLGTAWGGGMGVVHSVFAFNANNGLYENAALTFYDDNVAAKTQANICFSGRGRTYLQLNGIFNALTGPVSFKVVNNTAVGGTGLVRTVYIPPNGAARMAQ
jgi:prepilin-type N-terminal cleavage/methylation domain-containing protein